MSYSATIDVPDLEAGAAFYAALGWAERARPLPVMAVLEQGGQSLLLMQKPAGSQPTPDPAIRRDYARHWTPVHLDFHVADYEAALAAVLAAGATCEQRHDGMPGRPRVAFLSDPFGNGFCLIEERP